MPNKVEREIEQYRKVEEIGIKVDLILDKLNALDVFLGISDLTNEDFLKDLKENLDESKRDEE